MRGTLLIVAAGVVLFLLSDLLFAATGRPPVQAIGNRIASALVGLLYTVASPAVTFGDAAACMALALVGLIWAAPGRA